MIRSMTGYASVFRSTDHYDVTMEIKSVNSRYFEFKLKTFAGVDAWENEIKNAVFEKLKRGKIDLILSLVQKDAENYNIVVNFDLAAKYEKAIRELADRIGIVPDLSMRDFLSVDQILQKESTGAGDELQVLVMEMLSELLDKVLEMMYVEGESTARDIEHSLSIIEESVKGIAEVYPEALEAYKQSVQQRLIELYPAMNEDKNASARFMMELELVASRTAINEELVRLQSHLSQFHKILSGKAGGDSKRLDFLSQEMNRETNTIASKSSDIRIIDATITVKGEIEKIREQLRNLE